MGFAKTPLVFQALYTGFSNSGKISGFRFSGGFAVNTR